MSELINETVFVEDAEVDHCPRCGSANVESYLQEFYEHNFYNYCTCYECGIDYTEVYELYVMHYDEPSDEEEE